MRKFTALLVVVTILSVMTVVNAAALCAPVVVGDKTECRTDGWFGQWYGKTSQTTGGGFETTTHRIGAEYYTRVDAYWASSSGRAVRAVGTSGYVNGKSATCDVPGGAIGDDAYGFCKVSCVTCGVFSSVKTSYDNW